MKKLKNNLILLALVGFVLVSCGKNQAKQLVKTWQVTDIKTETELADFSENTDASGL